MSWVRFYIDIFHDIVFSYSLTATRTLTFGYIKWNPDVAFTGSFFDIVFGQYFRQGLGKKMPKRGGDSVVASFARKYHPYCHVCFVKNERLECEIKVYL